MKIVMPLFVSLKNGCQSFKKTLECCLFINVSMTPSPIGNQRLFTQLLMSLTHLDMLVLLCQNPILSITHQVRPFLPLLHRSMWIPQNIGLSYWPCSSILSFAKLSRDFNTITTRLNFKPFYPNKKL